MAAWNFSHDIENSRRSQSEALRGAASRFAQWLNVIPLPASVPKTVRDDITVYLYFEGKLLSDEVGQIVGRHRHSVINLLHARGLKPRTAQRSLRMRLDRGLPEDWEARFRSLRSELELPYEEIGRHFGRSAEWARYVSDTLGLPRRTPAEGRLARRKRLNPVEDADELLDPAFEARTRCADRLYCRIEDCGVPVTNLIPHYRAFHPKEFPPGADPRKLHRKMFPGVRVTTFAQEARARGIGVNTLMAKFAERFVTRAQLKVCRSNPYSDDRFDFYVCRICARKLLSPIERHLETEHDIELVEYHRLFPQAPTRSRVWMKRKADDQATIRQLAKAAPAAFAELEQMKIKESRKQDALKRGTAAAAERRKPNKRNRIGRLYEEQMPRAAHALAEKAKLPQAIRSRIARFGAAMREIGFTDEEEIDYIFSARQSEEGQKALARHFISVATGEPFELVKRHTSDYVKDHPDLAKKHPSDYLKDHAKDQF